MNRTIRVHVGDAAHSVGVLRYTHERGREYASFEYDAEWLAEPNRFSIDPTLPLVAGQQFHKKVGTGSIFHPAIADTEPDGWGKRIIHRDYMKRRQSARIAGEVAETDPLNALDLLLAVDDISRVGALRFRDESGAFQRGRDEGDRGIPPLIELRLLLSASRAVETNTETEADLAYLRGRGTSVGGLRPKCTVIDEEGWLSIGKFPSVSDERSVTKGEVLALKLAEAAGINAAQAQLVDSDDTPVALIRRFDRCQGSGRLMYVSAATMLGLDSTDENEHTYTEIVDAIRIHGSAAQSDIEELWRRIAFSILITNVDDHLLNHGFLHVHRGQWQLSPAFDINPTPDKAREFKTWIAEDTGPVASIEALLSVIEYFRIALARARSILTEVEDAVARWRDVGRSLRMSDFELDQFEAAFEHGERLRAQREVA